jgi:hypothetical protein
MFGFRIYSAKTTHKYFLSVSSCFPRLGAAKVGQTGPE